MYAGKRLPTEKEWEFAARGGLPEMTYHWGDNHDEDSYKLYNGELFFLYILARHVCFHFSSSGWQGKFPKENTVVDGYYGTSPVKAFPPNDYGVYGTTYFIQKLSKNEKKCNSWFRNAWECVGMGQRESGGATAKRKNVKKREEGIG